jgi:hypothetical protein
VVLGFGVAVLLSGAGYFYVAGYCEKASDENENNNSNSCNNSNNNSYRNSLDTDHGIYYNDNIYSSHSEFEGHSDFNSEGELGVRENECNVVSPATMTIDEMDEIDEKASASIESMNVSIE